MLIAAAFMALVPGAAVANDGTVMAHDGGATTAAAVEDGMTTTTRDYGLRDRHDRNRHRRDGPSSPSSSLAYTGASFRELHKSRIEEGDDWNVPSAAVDARDGMADDTDGVKIPSSRMDAYREHRLRGRVKTTTRDLASEVDDDDGFDDDVLDEDEELEKIAAEVWCKSSSSPSFLFPIRVAPLPPPPPSLFFPGKKRIPRPSFPSPVRFPVPICKKKNVPSHARPKMSTGRPTIAPPGITNGECTPSTHRNYAAGRC
jgi:hypothetical protein